ncbi:IclR family transcriptional regulator [Streptomyces sp. NPDC048659]|uniref:IclR family transcriptional regulator n=1 Tax=Streptomyces sp. NPDC048659 TaxID=3155489 RepID=UPI00342498F8
MTDLTAPVSMIDRISGILDVFEEADGLTMTEVIRRTGLPRSSVHRILEHLTSVRLLRRDEKVYRLGMRFMELGSLMYHRDQVRTAAMPYLQQLHWSTGLTSQLAVLDEDKVVYLLQVGAPVGIPSRQFVGGRFHASSHVVGKALLAYTPCPPGVDHPPVSRSLRAELADIRTRGIAFGPDAVAGIGCVATPVIGAGDRAALAAISISGPAENLEVPRLAAILRHTAATLRKGAPTLAG